ncbi:MAG: NAD(P)/FAD-dependent oxidoreductase [Euzebya sp.]
MLPDAARYVIIGAGIHGLSTAWRLATELTRSGRGSGEDVVVLDKTGVGAGASGIACGVIRNNYFQPAMRRLMQHSVGVWESDPKAFSYHPVGYLQLAPDVMGDDISQIYAEQREIGYASTMVQGESDCMVYMKGIFDDWRAQGITCLLHEKRGGFANNQASLNGLAAKAIAAGVRIYDGVTVQDLRLDGGAVTAVETDQGTVACDQIVVAVGPWVRNIWDMLDLPTTITVASPDGSQSTSSPMWTYWALQEGTLAVPPETLLDVHGNIPPVVHVDTDAPLYDPDGNLITDELWGIYYKPDRHFGGVQGGAMPYPVATPAAQVAVDPYGPASPDFVVGDDFARMWTSALTHCHSRFEGTEDKFSDVPSGGIGCFTPDSFPVFDRFRENAYVIADSNHGYKMIGVGALVTAELLGEEQDLLQPFRFDRYAAGRLHPTSHSPFPWS